MTTEHEMAMAIATEIGKQVPVKQVYEDTTSPAAKQVGATLEDVVKVVRLAGFPIQWLAVQQDRFRAFIERAKDQVPVERRILPEPRILGPILEGIRYETSETPLSELFSNLLAKSMDVDRSSMAHPSFPYILRQLNPAQAETIKIIHKHGMINLIEFLPGDKLNHLQFHPDDPARHLGIEDIAFHFGHLVHLDLLNPPLLTPWIKSEFFGGQSYRPVTYELSFIGNAFAAACLPQP